MAKTIKFNLICDDKPVRTIEDLQENFSIEDVLKYFQNGLLLRWLEVRGYETEYKKVSEIREIEALEIVKELIKIFDIEANSPKIISLLKRIAENNLYNDEYSATIFILSETTVIPKELENYITVFDIPLPTTSEILTIINDFVADMDIVVDQEAIDEIALSFKGLNEFQIKQILNLAYQDGGCIDKDDKLLILKEKEQFIKKSGMLEIVSFSETVDDIGGLV